MLKLALISMALFSINVVSAKTNFDKTKSRIIVLCRQISPQNPNIQYNSVLVLEQVDGNAEEFLQDNATTVAKFTLSQYSSASGKKETSEILKESPTVRTGIAYNLGLDQISFEENEGANKKYFDIDLAHGSTAELYTPLSDGSFDKYSCGEISLKEISPTSLQQEPAVGSTPELSNE